MRTMSERSGSTLEMFQTVMDKVNVDIRVAAPGVIQSFNSSEQTVTVRLALREKIRDDKGVMDYTEIPVLLDVPIVIPRAGGYALTLPIQAGDECLVIFADSCIDSWWSMGGVQNPIELRRHDLSDAFAILGTWSQPSVIGSYNSSKAELRSTTGTSKITVGANDVTIASTNVYLTGTVSINGVVFATHEHALDSGHADQKTGPPVNGP